MKDNINENLEGIKEVVINLNDEEIGRASTDIPVSLKDREVVKNQEVWY